MFTGPELKVFLCALQPSDQRPEIYVRRRYVYYVEDDHYQTSASTVSEETVGDGAMTTTGSPSNTSSQSICRWISTD